MIKIFADGADLKQIEKLNANPLVQGFTTNPTLMKKAGVKNYEQFAKDALKIIGDKPISFEVFNDSFDVMCEQALKIASWGNNIYVKIPVTNTKGYSSYTTIEYLVKKGVKLNVTAIFTPKQVEKVSLSLGNNSSIVSVFAGRIADTLADPMKIMKECSKITSNYPLQELLWASPREVYNIVQAEESGCQIITCQSDIIKRYMECKGKDLLQFSLETVQMFRSDAVESGYEL